MQRMRMPVALSLLMIVMSGYAASAANYPAYDDITVISVTPRSASTKPFVMAIYTKEQRDRVEALKKNPRR
jgi:hypothetical protein